MDSETSSRFERIEEDIKKLFTCTDNSNVWQGKYGEKIETIEKGIDKMTISIQELLNKPQRRWETVIASAISAVVGGGIAAIIARLFYVGMM